MSTVAERFGRVASKFTEVAEALPPEAWQNEAPCEGWVARDVVRHLIEWVPPFLANGAGVDVKPGPSVDDDPVGAWEALRDQLQAVLDDPATAARQFTNQHTGTHPLPDAIDRFIVGDVLVHTWDLARAAGSEVTLDPATVSAMLAGLAALPEGTLSSSGHYDRPVQVADDADEQTRLIALTGRRP